MTKTTDPNEHLYKVIRGALNNYMPVQQSSKDPDGNFSLVDIVTPEWCDSIKEGEEELDNLADFIISEMINAKLAASRY